MRMPSDVCPPESRRVRSKRHKLWQSLRLTTNQQSEGVGMTDIKQTLEPRVLNSKPDALAPDGSEIRLLSRTSRASFCHCTLPPGKVSSAVRHRTIEEIWYFLQGQGEVWRRLDDQEVTTRVRPGMSLTIPTGADFQFRNTGGEPLTFLIVTAPPWPGDDEAIRIDDHWEDLG